MSLNVRGGRTGKPPLEVRYHAGIGSGGTDEILRPTLMSVGGEGSYRLVKNSFGRRAKESQEEFRNVHYDEGEMDGLLLEADMDCKDAAKEFGMLEPPGLTNLSDGKGYALPLDDIPAVFFKYVFGAKGATRGVIEKETGCTLKIPKKDEEGKITIEGRNIAVIMHAKRRIDMLAWTNRFKEPPTHFISIPLDCPKIKGKIKLFKEAVLRTCGQDHGIVSKVFVAAAKLHITVGMARIFSSQEEEKAVHALYEVVDKAKDELDSKSLTIELGCLDCMEDDHAAAKIVYAKVKASDSFQKFVDAIHVGFIEKCPEMMQKEFERDSVKLHATVMNTKFLEPIGAELEVYRGKKRVRARPTMDARRLFETFGDYEFGKMRFEAVHLSKRFEFDGTGYYKFITKYII